MRKLKHKVWPHQIVVKVGIGDSHDVGMAKWCNENLGFRFKQWYSYSTGADNRLYAFKDESTLLVFKLKWGHLCQ